MGSAGVSVGGCNGKPQLLGSRPLFAELDGNQDSGCPGSALADFGRHFPLE